MRQDDTAAYAEAGRASTTRPGRKDRRRGVSRERRDTDSRRGAVSVFFVSFPPLDGTHGTIVGSLGEFRIGRRRGGGNEQNLEVEVGKPKRLLVVGGVAGGASAAARARRLDESCEIVVFDRGPFVSFANCGLPYYVGDVIADESKLLIASPQLFRDRFRIDVRVLQEVTAIDRERREVAIREVETGREYTERYDALVLAPGARPVALPIEGVDLPSVLSLRTIPDSRKIRDFIARAGATRAVVVGAGFVGLELAENLAHRGLSVTVVERDRQVLPPLDFEMASVLEGRMRERGVEVLCGQSVVRLRQASEKVLELELDSGRTLESSFAVLSVGVRPETKLAEQAGLKLGETGGILVDEQMRTTDPRVWAVGDAVEVVDIVTGRRTLSPLAGPANRQGRVAADAIFGRARTFRGVLGTAVCGCFGLTAACTGANEKALRRAGIEDYEVSYIHPGHHVGYFPGAKQIHLKLVYARADGRLYGAQAVGEEGTVRRIDVLSTAIQRSMSVYDLEELELCYAPQYGAAKDPVNLAGFVAANTLRKDMPTVSWSQWLDGSGAAVAGATLVDVRSAAEFESGHVTGALNIPLEEMRERHGELPRGKPILLYCQAGQRAYYATRLLMQLGYPIRNLPGGILTYRMFRDA